ncbi:hypothetical protein CEXT_561041 [Caerostris extrusa]|uniref:Uncharacterized protein n=1 Tax=Caerostris extrusa TaxID=172846 RepID=A0AAV4SSV6_CAEEX|nr:hypothetical protein CEXT_561041 [Caerostris extrusa]
MIYRHQSFKSYMASNTPFTYLMFIWIFLYVFVFGNFAFARHTWQDSDDALQALNRGEYIGESLSVTSQSNSDVINYFKEDCLNVQIQN